MHWLAAGLAISTGLSPETALQALAHLEGASGRPRTGRHRRQRPRRPMSITAHKPEALENVLFLRAALSRPAASWWFFGCGGDRDRLKRPIMGGIAARLADVGDRHRRQPAFRGAGHHPRGHHGRGHGSNRDRATGARRYAIAVALLQPGDTLIVAGKGHEVGQDHRRGNASFFRSRGGQGGPFRGGGMSLLWTSEALVAAVSGAPGSARCREGVSGISIDSRSLKPGDAFFAIQGRQARRAWILRPRPSRRGPACSWWPRGGCPALGRLNVADDRRAGRACRVGKKGRHRCPRTIRGHASSARSPDAAGKTTTKDMLRVGPFGRRHGACRRTGPSTITGGVPLTLARMPADCDYAVFEIGMNHAGEIRPLSQYVRAPTFAIVTMIARRASRQF